MINRTAKRKWIFLSAATLITATPLGILGWMKHMKDSQDIVIKAKGLDEVGVRLEVPHGIRSVKNVLLINDGPHTVIACDILFEVMTKQGQILSARKVVSSYVWLEKDSSKRKALLAEDPGIAPHTKWLVGFGEPGLEAVGSSLPPLRDEQGILPFPDIEKYKQVTITLNAVVVEDGRAFGPLAADFLRHLNEEVMRK